MIEITPPEQWLRERDYSNSVISHPMAGDQYVSSVSDVMREYAEYVASFSEKEKEQATTGQSNWQAQQQPVSKSEWISVEEAHKLLLQERNRAMEIAASFSNKYDKTYREKKASGSSMAFVQSEMSEVARYIMNSISGKTALNIDTPLVEIIKRDYPLPQPPVSL